MDDVVNLFFQIKHLALSTIINFITYKKKQVAISVWYTYEYKYYYVHEY